MMGKVKELITTTALVKEILKQDERARNSDSFLYLQVLKRQGKEKNIDLNHLPVSAFLLYMETMGFPPFESVRRARQKIQARHPELSANETVEEFRAENETEYRAFAVAEIN